MTTTLNLTDNAITVLQTRYLVKDESPSDLFQRVANHIAKPESSDQREYWTESFYDLMASCIFMPNSPTLFNAGTGQGTLSACFVIPVEDKMESIMQKISNQPVI